MPDSAPRQPPAAAAAHPAAEHSRTLAGILLLLGAMMLVPMMDGLAKHLSAHYATVQIVWARYFFHLAFLLPIVLWRYGRAVLRPNRPVAQVLRGGLLLGSTVLFFAAIRSMPLADAIALVFVYPFIVTALSPLLLGEKVGIRRWSAVLVGFAGALIVIRPGLGVFQWSALLALGGGSVYALYVMATRKLAGSNPPLVTLAYTALLGAVVMSAVAPLEWVAPRPLDWALMALMGAIAAGGHFLVIRAYECAPASLLSPYGYSEIVMATLVGFVGFGDFPDSVTWLGVAVIVASGVYIALRERQRHLPPATGGKRDQRL
ncbi:Threonine/homoserine efflux transporter RhtA [Tistlia consotensis]|uniref:Threonine/homoserine efflux transporter RhtA n=1 Tax=Tistlia consotensis USBA 355 TaxID=560819 RepID=A0A1Y6CA17_9PROT|nr:DMT family transporter [Tistlia consotensis]SMF44394.1 Threonine/homoserine efflux transporter RhtA [Tistlia consotensis USBA 355]SNR43240.1 Threonine/homoserine efflux transporter RhtA [Tistlia consotensis]